MKSVERIFECVKLNDLQNVKNWFVEAKDVVNAVNFRDMNDNTALHIACGIPSGNQQMVSLLLDLGFSASAQNSVGDTPLHNAVLVRNLAVVQLLLKRCSDKIYISEGNDYGNTPLHYACKQALLDVALLLLEHKALVHVENKMGQVPTDCCSTPLFKTKLMQKGRQYFTVQHARVPVVHCRTQDEGKAMARNRYIAQGSVPIAISFPLVRITKTRKTSPKFVTSHGEYLDADIIVKRSLFQTGDNEKVAKQCWDAFVSEISQLRQLSHPNLLPILGILDEPSNSILGVVMDFVSFVPQSGQQQLSAQQLLAMPSSLKDFLEDPSCNLTQKTAVKILQGVCAGLCYLHNAELSTGSGFHGNLKSSNVLLKPGLVPVLTEYGFARSKFNSTFDQTYLLDVTYTAPELLRDNALFVGKRITMAEADFQNMSQALKATKESTLDQSLIMKRWMAMNRPASVLLNRTTIGSMNAANLAKSNFRLNDPESASSKCQAADMYSFGILMWETVVRQSPYQQFKLSKKSVPSPTLIALKVLVENMRPDIPAFVPEEFAVLMTLCWAESPAQRPNANEALERLKRFEFTEEDFY